MGTRLKLFFAHLFLLIGSMSTEQSQMCVMNTACQARTVRLVPTSTNFDFGQFRLRSAGRSQIGRSRTSSLEMPGARQMLSRQVVGGTLWTLFSCFFPLVFLSFLFSFFFSFSFLFFIFFHFLSFSFIFFHFLASTFIYFHFLSFSFIFLHFPSFSFSLLGAQNLIFFFLFLFLCWVLKI